MKALSFVWGICEESGWAKKQFGGQGAGMYSRCLDGRCGCVGSMLQLTGVGGPSSNFERMECCRNWLLFHTECGVGEGDRCT